MGKLKELTEVEAYDRLHWLGWTSGLELRAAVESHPENGEWPILDAKAIEKLHEISHVCREVAKHYTDREPQVEWEIGEEPVPDYMSTSAAESLYNADPDCRHVHDNNRGPLPSGIKCARCPGWFCY